MVESARDGVDAAAAIGTIEVRDLFVLREQLATLDEAIADCRAQIARNRANPELREELLSIYREKQRTLELLIREE